MKKKIIIIGIVVLLLILGSVIGYQEQENIADYEGKWKVIKLLTYTKDKSNFFPEHYLGRTVVVGENFVEQSIWEWPWLLEWASEYYDYADVVYYSKDEEWVPKYCHSEVKELVDGDKIHFIRYFNKSQYGDYCTNYFVILDKTHLICSFLGSYYLLEPFRYCDPTVSEKNLNGTWEIAYLDSYENSYEGSYEEIEKEAPRSSLKGTDFNVEDWLGKSVTVSENEVRISETGYQTAGMESGKIRREDFEQKMDIHDGLSIYDDEILVCNIKCQNGENIICVPVNENQMIMRIEEGWFMLEKE